MNEIETKFLLPFCSRYFLLVAPLIKLSICLFNFITLFFLKNVGQSPSSYAVLVVKLGQFALVYEETYTETNLSTQI